MHLSVLDLLWGQELKKGTGSEFTDSTAFSLEGLVLRALHDRLQESHTNHTMMWDDKRCILALGRNKQSLKTNSTAPPSQTWLQSSQRTSRNLPAPCHHLWSGWLPVWPTQHDDGAGDTQIIKKKTGSAQLKRISFMQKQELLCKEILHLKNATWHVKTQSLHQSILSSGVWQQRCLKPKQRCHRKDFGPGLDFVSGHFGLFQWSNRIAKQSSHLQWFWANYNNSLTWIKAIWGWFPLLTMISSEVAVRSL